MALVKRALALLMSITLAMELIHAAVYKVGDSTGWTTIGNFDYKKWSATKTFQVHDIILFEYNAQFHNVMRVTHAMYKACNTSAPLATYTTGNDSITIKTRGHHFFFCGVPGHCQAGQKVDINVPQSNEMAPASSVSSSESSPPVPSAKVPGPAPSNAMPLKALKIPSGNIGLAMAVLATFLINFA
ncbi:PREDICTED: mavicyanin-like [Populus euphratica]|uniref:Mavicyanin-like n=1 Tax=Populus euphratica TaxID=75702 RepID=A0AAJ6UCB3_POPEU|nr:PREDICTED: mavicyanin-like [Populus euphratica]